MAKNDFYTGKYIVEINHDYVRALCRQHNKGAEEMMKAVYQDLHDFIHKKEATMVTCCVFRDDEGRLQKAFTIKRLAGPRLGKRLKHLKRKK